MSDKLIRLLMISVGLLFMTSPILGQDRFPGNPPGAPMEQQPAPPERQGRPHRPIAAFSMPRSQPAFTIVTTRPMERDVAASLAEDIPVMLQILRKNLDKGSTSLVPMELLGLGQGQFQGIYVQGHGLILLGRAMLAPGQELRRQPAGPDQARHADPIWQQAREELGTGTISQIGIAGRPFGPGQGEGWKEAELVDQMIRTLKHASNIRALSKDDLVTICVTGQPANQLMIGQAIAIPTEPYGSPMPGSPPPTPAVAAGPTFTIQATRSDIELFASGQISFDQFKQKVKALTY